jgi:hemerythrin
MNENNGIEWSGDLSVNNVIIDKQHKHIFAILDQLSMQLPDDAKKNQFARLLTELTEYGLNHLKEEEKFMAENLYPGLDEHKKVHKAYLLKVATFNIRFNETSQQEVVDFLRDWWFNHISKMDMQYRDYINSKKL